LGGGLHPCSRERHKLADEEQPEIAMFQRSKSVAPCRAARAPGLPRALMRNIGVFCGGVWFVLMASLSATECYKFKISESSLRLEN
jgi:hypothetical protein